MSFLVPKGDSRIHRPSGSAQLDFVESSVVLEGDLKGVKSVSSSVINFYPRWCKCFACLLRSRHGKGDKVPCCTRCRDACSCPPTGIVSRFIIFFCIAASFWFVTWCLDRNLAEDTISAMIILEILGMSTGICFKLCGLPALLAPLIIGIILNNIPYINFFWGLHERGWIHPIREMALAIILTRAGVELSPKQMKKLKGIVPLAAFGPCIIEAMACALFFYAMFYTEDVDVALCFVAGFALAAVSPAVVVPGMLSLKRKRFGEQQGVSTLLIAASSIDDVLAITAFSIALSFVDRGQPSGESKWKAYAGFVGIIVGILHGLIVGVILHFVPSKDVGRSLPDLRTVLLLLMNFTCIFMYDKVDALKWLSGAGSLGVLCTSFFASFGWRSVPHWKRNMKKMEKTLAHIWTLCVPLLFGTIGHEINFLEIGKHVETLGKLLVVILCSLLIRCAFMFCLTIFTKFNKKERLFCALAWVPKATVQAALAPLVKSELEVSKLETVRKHSQNVVTMAVFAILITAPLGAIFINLAGPKLLKKAPDDPDDVSLGPAMEDDPDTTNIILSRVSRVSSNEDSRFSTVFMKPGDEEGSPGQESRIGVIPLDQGQENNDTLILTKK